MAKKENRCISETSFCFLPYFSAFEYKELSANWERGAERVGLQVAELYEKLLHRREAKAKIARYHEKLSFSKVEDMDFDLESVPEEERECAICHAPLVDLDEHEQNETKLLPTEANIAKLSIDLQEADALAVSRLVYAKSDFKDLEDEASILESLRTFADKLAKTCVIYQNLRESVLYTCLGPVQTKCGHIFGKFCLLLWIQQCMKKKRCAAHVPVLQSQNLWLTKMMKGIEFVQFVEYERLHHLRMGLNMHINSVLHPVF
jgi:hypothetical protein